MTKYAEGTSVSPERSMEEIKQTITRFGASKFALMMTNEGVAVGFEMKQRRVRFSVPLPRLDDFKLTPGRKIRRSTAEQLKAHDQATRQCYRALSLVIKAKLEAVESGIETFDEAFLAHIVLPSGQTMSEWAAPQMDLVLAGQMPPLLQAPQER